MAGQFAAESVVSLHRNTQRIEYTHHGNRKVFQDMTVGNGMMERLSNRKWRELLGRYIFGLNDKDEQPPGMGSLTSLPQNQALRMRNLKVAMLADLNLEE